MNENINTQVGYVSPLKRICMTIGELPSSYLETMTYYEMLLWFTKYLKETLIPTINNNADAVTELQNLYLQLQEYVNNYFDNLDVQEEIDNKLDDMVEQGTLQEIIADYLNSKAVFGYDNVTCMKEATNLINGSYAKTLGYYSKNDEGSALYKIREITNQDVVDDMTIIAIGNDNLIAELINLNINPEMLGAKGDGITDDTLPIQTGLNKFKTIKLNKLYKISETINVPANSYITGNGTILNENTNTYALSINYESNIENIKINGNNIGNGITIIHRNDNQPDRNILSKIRILNCVIGVNANGTGDIYNSCVIDGGYTTKQILTNSCGILISNTDSFINNCIILRCDVGIYSVRQFSMNNGKILVCNYGMILGSISNDTLPNYSFKETTQKTCTNPKLNNVIIQEQKKLNIIIFRAENPLLNITSEGCGDGYTSEDYVDNNGYPLANVFIGYCRNGDININSHINLSGGSEKYCVYFDENFSVSYSNININCDTERSIDYQFNIINTLKSCVASNGKINGIDMFLYAINDIDSKDFSKSSSSQWTLTQKENYKICEGIIDASSSGHNLILDTTLDNITNIGVYTLLTNITFPENVNSINLQIQGSNDQTSYTTIGNTQSLSKTNYNIATSIRSLTNTYKYIRLNFFIDNSGYYKFNMYNKIA